MVAIRDLYTDVFSTSVGNCIAIILIFQKFNSTFPLESFIQISFESSL